MLNALPSPELVDTEGPVVYGEYLYIDSSSIVRRPNAGTGDEIHKECIDSQASIIPSPVATDGEICCASEEEIVNVLAAGKGFEGGDLGTNFSRGTRTR